MRSVWIRFAALTVLASALWTCNRTFDPTPAHVEQIFPIEDGKYRVYAVLDTIYTTSDPTRDFEVQTYYKQELTDGTETDLLDREVSKLWIYRSPDTLGTPDAPVYSWDFFELWTQYKGEDFTERIEGNTRFLILRNPPYPDATWDGNLFNNEDRQTYQYINIDTTVTVQGNTYENCVFVLQQEFFEPVEDTTGSIFISDHAYEIYAPNIGLILKYRKNLLAQSGGDWDPSSRILREELVEHNY